MELGLQASPEKSSPSKHPLGEEQSRDSSPHNAQPASEEEGRVTVVRERARSRGKGSAARSARVEGA